MTFLTHRNNLIGILALILGIFVFSIQDAIIKSISGEHAVTLAIFIRAIVADVFQAHAVNPGGQLSLEAPVNQARDVDQDFGHRGERLGRQAFWGKPDKFWR